MKKTNLFKMFIASVIMTGVVCIPIFARGWATDGFEWFYYEDDQNTIATETIKASGDDKYYLDANGLMVRDYLLEDYNESVYYFDDTGKMVKNTWVAVDPTQVVNAMDNPPSIYLYYFGANGKAFKAKSGSVLRKGIDGKKYLFNENGQMLSGWINEQGERYNEFDTEEDPFVGYCYYAGDETDGVLREGWSEYTDGSVNDNYYLKQSLWFYFNTGTNKKVCSDSADSLTKKKVNGHTYGFDYNGVMIQGWDSDMVDLENTNSYFSETSDETGRMHKKEWVFAVPSEIQNPEDHDQDVSRWFYANAGGDIYKNVMRKINSKYYVFNKQGIMKSGLCIIDGETKEFVDCIDVEKTDGKDFIISRYYISTETYADNTSTDVYTMFDDTKDKIYYFNMDEMDEKYGERKIGEVTIPFADADYTFDSLGPGEKEGEKYKKYYQAGIKLQADPVLGLGLVFLGYSSDSTATGISSNPVYNNSTGAGANVDKNHNDNMNDYIVNMDKDFCETNSAYPVFSVVDAKGNKINKSNIYKKDKSGNYWLIGANKTFVKAFDVPIKYVKSEGQWYYKSEKIVNGKSKSDWIPFRTAENESTEDDSSNLIWQDVYGRCCDARRDKTCDYEIPIDDLYATNFRIADSQ